MDPADVPAVAVLGPTGSGKSWLAMTLASKFGGEIISCDALQVYRGMDIGTAKATRAERQAVPHHMLDLREPGEVFSAGDYQHLARESLGKIRDRGHIPFVAGGTGFYLRALTDGLFEGPGRSEELRGRMRAILRRGGIGRLYRALVCADPAAARRIMPSDSSRILRAYEVYLMTGTPMSKWQERPLEKLVGFRWLKLGLAWPREVLYQRINGRVEDMFRAGFVEEVGGLLEKYPRECHALKAIGYRQIADYLKGRCSLEQAMESTKQESRRYAKRQLTWFRALPDLIWLDADRDLSALEREAIAQVRQHLELR